MKRIGCVDCRLIEPIPGLWIEGRCPGCRNARGLKTTRIGRPKTRLSFTSDCQGCGKKFTYISARRDERKFCSRRCNLEHKRNMRRKIPDAEKLHELYVKRNLSTPKIAEMYGTDARTVNQALRKADIPLRRKTKALECSVRGCKNRVKKIRHSSNGVLYGTLCALHRYEHRLELAREYRRTKKRPQDIDAASGTADDKLPEDFVNAINAVIRGALPSAPPAPTEVE